MRKHIIKSTACMWKLKTYTDFRSCFLIDRFCTDYNKTRNIFFVVADVFSQNRKAIQLSCSTTCNS